MNKQIYNLCFTSSSLLKLLLFFSLFLTGCSSSANEAAYSEVDSSGAIAPMAPAEEPAPAPASGEFADGVSVPIEDFLATAVQAQESRVIIYTGNIALVVKDTRESIDAITALVDEVGGYISNSNLYEAGEALRGTVTVRVPAERYQAVLEQLRNLALRVEREDSSSQDVTEEFTDLQARKTNLEFTEDALQQLLEERQRTGSTSDILEVYRELTNIRGQIEQIEGRLRYLSNQSALATITINLTPDILYQPISVAGWEPQGVAREAFQALIVALQGLATVLIWLFILGLPLLLIFILVLLVIFWIGRWVWRRIRKATPPAPPPPPVEAPGQS
jgi:hypothetical protein